MRQIQFSDIAFEQFTEWANTDRKTFNKIARLVEECRRTPFTGTGKPEPLKHQHQGCWSRRITDEHRFVYRVQDDVILVLACKHHYE
ncbi:MAG: Txe/YoeB family addiction module toxin [Candidatus Kapaibacterium sp.]|nr:MAG: Txe/YoeB family addiction module toxin [Candidatus Kapabacteria bacterium]